MTAAAQDRVRCTVVVPTRDRSEAAVRQVGRLRELGADDIVVVADGCADDTVTRLAEIAGPDLEVVITDGEGAAAARNRGAAAATRPWLVFLDDDDEPDDGWLDALRALAEPPGRGLVSVGHRRRGPDGDVPATVQASSAAFSGAAASFWAGTFAVDRDLFSAVGGFREDLRFMELTDLLLRACAEAAADGRGFGHDPQAHITIVERPPAERASVRPEVLAEAGARVLDSCGHLLARDRHLHANCLAVVAVAELRSGATATGRRRMIRAARTSPWPPRHVARAVAAQVGPLRRRIWLPR